jgi:alkylation response protein AidB-like acyl-CoA dehydrogenase
VTDLADLAARLAPESERARRLPDELVTAMTDAGVFRMLVPEAAGGLERHPAELVDTVADLARGDGAAGWCAAIGATSGLLAAYLPQDSAREIYADPRAISGGVFAPRGRATRHPDGGFSVSGRWPFASGCTHCSWLMGGCIIEGDDPPMPTLMIAPAAEVTIHEDTWDSMGLRGTGSHDIEMRDVHVPAERAASLIGDRPTAPGRLYAFPVFGLLALAIGAVGLGIARGALDDIQALAGVRTPTGSRRTMAERTAVQSELAGAEASLRAARALLDDAIERAWAAATSGEVPLDERAALRLAATHAATTGAEITTTAYQLGGGSSVYESKSPLPRRFRDAHTATQHMLVAPATNELAGRLILGLPTDTSQL